MVDVFEQRLTFAVFPRLQPCHNAASSFGDQRRRIRNAFDEAGERLGAFCFSDFARAAGNQAPLRAQAQRACSRRVSRCLGAVDARLEIECAASNARADRFGAIFTVEVFYEIGDSRCAVGGIKDLFCPREPLLGDRASLAKLRAEVRVRRLLLHFASTRDLELHDKLR